MMPAPTMADIATFLLGFSWAVIGLPLVLRCWRLSRRILFPIQRDSILTVRLVYVGIAFYLYIMFIASLAAFIRRELGVSGYGTQPLGFGSLAGLVFIVLSLRYGAINKKHK
jgi:hypothetical protein